MQRLPQNNAYPITNKNRTNNLPRVWLRSRRCSSNGHTAMCVTGWRIWLYRDSYRRTFTVSFCVSSFKSVSLWIWQNYSWTVYIDTLLSPTLTKNETNINVLSKNVKGSAAALKTKQSHRTRKHQQTIELLAGKHASVNIHLRPTTNVKSAANGTNNSQLPYWQKQ